MNPSWLAHGAYGLLLFIGVGHFVADVVAQKLRGVRPPGLETTRFYGLNTSYALGQVVLGVVGLWLLRRAPALARANVFLAVSAFAGVSWLLVSFFFMEYREPRYAAGLFLVVLSGVVLTR